MLGIIAHQEPGSGHDDGDAPGSGKEFPARLLRPEQILTQAHDGDEDECTQCAEHSDQDRPTEAAPIFSGAEII